MWPFSRTRSELYSWPILRTKPLGLTRGRAIRVFINDGACHLASVNVYADGAIDCWGFVDRALFSEKLSAKWVVAAPRNAQQISIFNFGYTRWKDRKWFNAAQGIRLEVGRSLMALNPGMRNLLGMKCSDTEVKNGSRCAKVGVADGKPYRLVAGVDVRGESLPVLRNTDGVYELTDLFVYSDGALHFGSNASLMSIEAIERMYATGELRESAPAASRVRIPGIGEFTCVDVLGAVHANDRIAEIRDTIHTLQGQPSAVVRCRRAYELYEQSPSDQNKEALRIAYEEVPSHLRCYCGDMDTRDTEIRRVLFGEARVR